MFRKALVLMFAVVSIATAQQPVGWWKPVEPALPATWWAVAPATPATLEHCPCSPGCDCKGCDCPKKLSYATAYDLGKSTGLPIVVFNHTACRDVAIAGQWEPIVAVAANSGTAWKDGVMLARYLADGWRVEWFAPGVTKEELRAADVKLANGTHGPKTVADAASVVAASVLVGLVAPDFDMQPVCPGPDCPDCPQQVRRGGSILYGAPQSFSGGGVAAPSVTYSRGESVTVSAGRSRGPLRRLFGAVRAARAARFAILQPVDPVPPPDAGYQVASAGPRTFTKYQTVPVETYTLEPVTESVPVVRYRWVPQSAKAEQMPPKPKN
jgi:hypothetical protein